MLSVQCRRRPSIPHGQNVKKNGSGRNFGFQWGGNFNCIGHIQSALSLNWSKWVDKPRGLLFRGDYPGGFRSSGRDFIWLSFDRFDFLSFQRTLKYLLHLQIEFSRRNMFHSCFARFIYNNLMKFSNAFS